MASLNDYYGLVDELPEGRAGTPFNHGGAREYTRKFLVHIKNKEMGPVAVCWHPGLPKRYDFYKSKSGVEYDLTSLCIKKSAVPKNTQQGDDWVQWIVTCEYSSELGKMAAPDDPGDPGDPGKPESGDSPKSAGASTNPELEPPELEWDWEIKNEAIPVDLDGQPFINSANQPLSPPPTVEVAFPVLVVTRNELQYDVDVAAEYAYAVNQDVFMGRDAGTVQCMPARAKAVYRGFLQYYRVTYRLRIRTDGKTWQPEYLDAGTCRLQNTPGAPNQGQPVPIIRFGAPITQPVLLKQGQPQTPPFKPYYIRRRVYESKPFKRVFTEGKGMTKPPTPPKKGR